MNQLKWKTLLGAVNNAEFENINFVLYMFHEDNVKRYKKYKGTKFILRVSEALMRHTMHFIKKT